MAVFDFIKDAPARGQTEDKRLAQIPIQRIQPNPNQPRHTFDEESIAELAQSIRQVGLIQPLIVRRAGDHYELVAGERRLRACKSLGMEDVTCIVQASVEEEASAMMALIENLQREDLYFLEEAQCYYTLLTTYDLTQEELAQRLGKSQSSIANKLRVLRLPSSVKAAMKEQGLTERHARALLKLKNEKEQLAVVRKVAEKVFIPFTVGGGIRTVEDFRAILREGADKISVNSAAINTPRLIADAADKFGSQCVVVAIDAKRRSDKSGWNVYKNGGRIDTGLDVLEWAQKAQKLGAGEILLTSMDCDGTKAGYDIELTRAVSDLVSIPVIASGGAGTLEHFREALTEGGADAALAASLFHYKELEIAQVKEYLKEKGVPVRWQ